MIRRLVVAGLAFQRALDGLRSFGGASRKVAYPLYRKIHCEVD